MGSWDFCKLSEALCQWVKRNPAGSNDKEREDQSRRTLFHSRGEETKLRGRVCCEDSGHKAVQCAKVTDSGEREKILAKKGLCFNCATQKHALLNVPAKRHVGPVKNVITHLSATNDLIIHRN